MITSLFYSDFRLVREKEEIGSQEWESEEEVDYPEGQFSLLEKLPLDIWNHIIRYLAPRDIQSLTSTSKTIHYYAISSAIVRSKFEIRELVTRFANLVDEKTYPLLKERLSCFLSSPCTQTIPHLVALKKMILEREEQFIRQLELISPSIIQVLSRLPTPLFFDSLRQVLQLLDLLNKPHCGDQRKEICRQLINLRAFAQVEALIQKTANMEVKDSISFSFFQALAANEKGLISSSVFSDQILNEGVRDATLAILSQSLRDRRDFSLEKKSISLISRSFESSNLRTRQGEQNREHFRSLLARGALGEAQKIIDGLQEHRSEYFADSGYFRKLDAIAMFAESLIVLGKPNVAIGMFAQIRFKEANKEIDALLVKFSRNLLISKDYASAFRCVAEARQSRTKDEILNDIAKSFLFSGEMKECFKNISQIQDSKIKQKAFIDAAHFCLAKQDWDHVFQIVDLMGQLSSGDSSEKDEIIRQLTGHLIILGKPLEAIRQAGRIESHWIRDNVLRSIFRNLIEQESSLLREALSEVSNPVSRSNMAKEVMQDFIQRKAFNEAYGIIDQFFALSSRTLGYLDIVQVLVAEGKFLEALRLIERIYSGIEEEDVWSKMRLVQEQIRIFLFTGRLEEAFVQIASLPASSLLNEGLIDLANLLIRMDQKAEAHKILDRVMNFVNQNIHLRGERYDKDLRSLAEAWLLLGELLKAKMALSNITSVIERDSVHTLIFRTFLAEKKFSEAFAEAKLIQETRSRDGLLKELFESLINVGILNDLIDIASSASAASTRSNLLQAAAKAFANAGNPEKAFEAAHLITQQNRKTALFRKLLEIFKIHDQKEWVERTEQLLSEASQQKSVLKRKRG